MMESNNFFRSLVTQGFTNISLVMFCQQACCSARRRKVKHRIVNSSEYLIIMITMCTLTLWHSLNNIIVWQQLQEHVSDSKQRVNILCVCTQRGRQTFSIIKVPFYSTNKLKESLASILYRIVSSNSVLFTSASCPTSCSICFSSCLQVQHMFR